MTEEEIELRFLRFHAQNPHVYTGLVRLAREARARGAGRLGIRQLWEVMRWQTGDFSVDDDYRLNDHYHSRYARLIMQEESDLAGVFELRALRTTTWLFSWRPGQGMLDV